ncbi:zinc transporter ZIP13 [Parasteatoda tepidariorum]|uniref:zinc transporter ZIP13 n=1 Tax=Parasteatoda tepidariorum TaxID=114398 RepID=UPI00077F8C0B|nr:zinc transporter ZIP13 [Parasteatoda tepidariorum]
MYEMTLFYCLCLCFVHLVRGMDMGPENSIASENSSSMWFEDLISHGLNDKQYQTWILSILASCVVGLSGIVPLIFVPIDAGTKINEQGGSKFLRLLLSFAVGGLLGDVFLHLLPEAWNHIESLGPEVHSSHITLGLWVLLGMFSFVILELMFAASHDNKEVRRTSISHAYTGEKQQQLNGSASCNGHSMYHETYAQQLKPKLEQNGSSKSNSNGCIIKEPIKVIQNIHIAGYLNLMANSIDNFTHGLAVAGSFLVGIKMGVLTTFAILIHEIPHEIGDFAILLKSGFNPWNAAKAQISTATIGILGAVVALSSESEDKLGTCTAWILPFTSGGFLNIALVNVLPDIMKEKDPWESMKQMACLCGGIGVMGLINLLVH